jgi:mannose-6-phosphate isomerase-like protein (cupin superfamily)
MKVAIQLIAFLWMTSAAIQLDAQAVQSPNVANPVTPLLTSPPPGASQTPSVLLQKDVRARLDALVPAAKATGSGSATLVDYGSYKLQLSVRTASGGAEIHAHWDDVMMVESGSATLLTGGTVPGAATSSDGETHGPKVDGGQRQALAPGDMVTVRAGTPHQILVEPGTVYEAVVVKVHEP